MLTTPISYSAALEAGIPLLTLDTAMKHVAKGLKIRLVDLS